MNTKIITLIFLSAFLGAGVAKAQEIPAEIKAKIVAASKERKAPEDKQRAWARRQIEAWESINTMTFQIPKADVDAIKATAQKKFPWTFAKQEPFISDQVDAFAELADIKKTFDKDDAKTLVDALLKEKDGDYRAVVDALSKDAEIYVEIKETSIEGVDPEMLAALKKAFALQFPTDLTKQREQLRKYESIMSVYNRALEEKRQRENAPQEKKITKSEILQKAEAAFNKSTIIITGNGKTATGIVVEIKGEKALIFPASLYSGSGLTATNTSGDEASISLKKVFSAKNAPLMLVFLKDFPFEVGITDFATADELRDNINKPVILVGYSGEQIRPALMHLSKVVKETIKMTRPVMSSYYEGSLILDQKTFKPVAIAVLPEREMPDFDFTSNRLASDYNRVVERLQRQLISIRTDVPLEWEPVEIDKMREQVRDYEKIKSINEALSVMISGSLDDALRHKACTAIVEKARDTLSRRMDISKVRLEYRSYITQIINMIRRPLEKAQKEGVYANLRNEEAFQIKFTSAVYAELKNELRNNSYSLAPREFRKAFEK